MNYKTILVFFAYLAIVLGLFGCASQPIVKTDLDNFNKNIDSYQGKEVIITTDLENLFEDPKPYVNRKLELRGYVEYNGFNSFRAWNFMLKDEEGRSLRCYERSYRLEAWSMPVAAIRKAEEEQLEITIVGKLELGQNVELDWIEVDGQRFNTDIKPHRIPSGFLSNP
jgi:hypothetical protein